MLEESVSHNLLTIKEVAAYLRIPVPTAYYLAQRGQIPAIQIGGRWRIKKAALDRDVLREGKSGQPTVLVVEDDLTLQAVFKVFLKKIGFGRVVVGTANEAMACLAKQRFDLMFLDLLLPDAAADVVHENARLMYPDLIIVLITGHPNSDALARILRLSPVTVIKKPFEIEALHRLITILGHKELMSDQARATA
jgi:excisionase family DNA binding protein